ncbi:chloride channel protein, partial [bacterium]|nr:chloride channel protein [bacterium]
MRFGKVWDSYSRDIKLMLTCVIAGIAVGLSVVFFHGILKAFENMITAFQTAELREFLPLVPIITALGGLSVGLLDHTIFKGITGEGFRGVVKAIAIENGIMRRRHTLKAIITSAFSISTGGGAGREAPTVIMGASLASAVGRL